MTPKIVTAKLGTDIVSESVPAPRSDPGFWERFGIRWSGLVDRVRTKQVDDTEHTHYLHRLAHEVRRREAEVVSGADRCFAHLRLLAAEAEHAASDHVAPAPSEPTLSELASLSGKDRTGWADDVRSARVAASAAAAASARVRAAQLEIVRVGAERESVLAQASAVRILWAEAFAVRAALYERARHGVFGRRSAAAPAIPVYRPTIGHADPRVLGSVGPIGPVGPTGDR
ncbi:hypothetical protein C5C74_09530 [Rathayibacter sp. AY1E8]|uniref:hypothetical protein n=1 Tax=unclassified Rathayibacter TaxID=2609250 RepID=UPI000CE9031D|nr:MULTISPECIES: hypothetical protein [unclassified Rathayibacter]PPG17971.1 hypothetical protein C5C74_09530 [Rathayibacter sp. AY1E8]PPI01187.1 hypothetical protein C5C95_03355 [Rathayibacter sp. AY1B7]